MDNIPKIEHRVGVISVKKQQRSSRLLILEVKTKVAFQDFKISRFQDVDSHQDPFGSSSVGSPALFIPPELERPQNLPVQQLIAHLGS